MSLTESLWPGLAVWLLLYLADYAMTLACPFFLGGAVQMAVITVGQLRLARKHRAKT